MSKLRIEHGASKINLVQLKTNIEESISNDIDLLAEWSNNERRYVINELLRFALTQNEDFLKFKAERQSRSSSLIGSTKPASSTATGSALKASTAANSPVSRQP